MITVLFSIVVATICFYAGIDGRRSKIENELTHHDLISGYEYQYQEMWWVYILVGIVCLIIGISQLIELLKL